MKTVLFILCHMMLLLLGLSGAISVSAAESQREGKRAEATAQILAFSLEALKVQSPPVEYARWPVPLRDSLIYWLGYKPFSSWSPDLQQYALGRFQKLASDTAKPSHLLVENKAAVIQWLKEPEPFMDAALRFDLGGMVSVSTSEGHVDCGMSWDVWGASIANIPQLGRLLSSFTDEQKRELFSNKMHIPVSRLTPEQKLLVETLLKPACEGVSGTENDSRRAYQFPDALFSISFQFRTCVKRKGNGKEDFFEAPIVYLLTK